MAVTASEAVGVAGHRESVPAQSASSLATGAQFAGVCTMQAGPASTSLPGASHESTAEGCGGDETGSMSSMVSTDESSEPPPPPVAPSEPPTLAGVSPRRRHRARMAATATKVHNLTLATRAGQRPFPFGDASTPAPLSRPPDGMQPAAASSSGTRSPVGAVLGDASWANEWRQEENLQLTAMRPPICRVFRSHPLGKRPATAAPSGRQRTTASPVLPAPERSHTGMARTAGGSPGNLPLVQRLVAAASDVRSSADARIAAAAAVAAATSEGNEFALPRDPLHRRRTAITTLRLVTAQSTIPRLRVAASSPPWLLPAEPALPPQPQAQPRRTRPASAGPQAAAGRLAARTGNNRPSPSAAQSSHAAASATTVLAGPLAIVPAASVCPTTAAPSAGHPRGGTSGGCGGSLCKGHELAHAVALAEACSTVWQKEWVELAGVAGAFGGWTAGSSDAGSGRRENSPAPDGS